MKKIVVATLSIIVVALVFAFYENYKAAKEVNLVWEFWRVAIDQAQQERLTTEQFYKKYDHLGEFVSDDIMPSPALKQSVPLSGFLCSEYSLRIYYSSAADDSASSMFITARSHDILCMI